MIHECENNHKSQKELNSSDSVELSAGRERLRHCWVQSQEHHSPQVWDMSRFLVFVVVTLALSRDGCCGNEGFTGLEDLSDGDYTDRQIPVKRTSYQEIRSADAVILADHPNVCYFIHEDGADGQISCRLRFTRSKFNFNPFGLRFGKREQSAVTKRAASSSYIIPYLLQLKDRLMPACQMDPSEHC